MEPLKNMISPDLVRSIAKNIQSAYPEFKSKTFSDMVLKNWETRELKDRVNHIAICLKEILNIGFEQEIEIIEQATLKMPAGFEQIFGPTYIEFYGLEHFERSMLAMERITHLSSAEFAIRPFIQKWPEKTMARMLSWSKHKSEHVRRLASEGCRPRLPWGGVLKDFVSNPTPILPILENLKNDDSLYVRKSVANNLNDISKDHAEVVLETCSRWIKENHQYANWISKKALRTLLKVANPNALNLFGYGLVSEVSVNDLKVKNNKISIGERLDFSFDISNSAKQENKLRVEYIINYKKKSGSANKVFQVSEFVLEAESAKCFEKYQSFADMTTRKHYRGNHSITIRVNGVNKSSLNFEVI